MYAEFGTSDTDTVSVTITYSSTTTAKKFNVLARQISCTASWKAPEDCVQYLTGASGSVQSYNFAGGQLLTQQQYTNCVRTEKGYCGQSSHLSSPTSNLSRLTLVRNTLEGIIQHLPGPLPDVSQSVHSGRDWDTK